MSTKEIASVQHPLIKRAVCYRLEKRAREEDRRVLISGKKLISDLAPFWPLEKLFFIGHPPQIPSKDKIQVSLAVLKKITGQQAPDGWAAIAPIPPSQSLSNKQFLLVLDQVSDPGNLGTLWRTALALGWEGIWLTPKCVDPFNDKALRAAKGATFRLPYERKTPAEILAWAKEKNALLFLADLEGIPLDQCKEKRVLALVLSNEGKGADEWPDSQKVMIPMASSVESLNVACAGAILLYGMRPSR